MTTSAPPRSRHNMWRMSRPPGGMSVRVVRVLCVLACAITGALLLAGGTGAAVLGVLAAALGLTWLYRQERAQV